MEAAEVTRTILMEICQSQTLSVTQTPAHRHCFPCSTPYANQIESSGDALLFAFHASFLMPSVKNKHVPRVSQSPAGSCTWQARSTLGRHTWPHSRYNTYRGLRARQLLLQRQQSEEVPVNASLSRLGSVLRIHASSLHTPNP